MTRRTEAAVVAPTSTLHSLSGGRKLRRREAYNAKTETTKESGQELVNSASN
jgi:hypothetical protein